MAHVLTPGIFSVRSSTFRRLAKIFFVLHAASRRFYKLSIQRFSQLGDAGLKRVAEGGQV